MKKKGILLFFILIILGISIGLFFLNSKENGGKTISDKNKKEEIIKLNGEKVDFKKYRINQQFYLKIPELFVQMSDEEVNNRYTNDFKPGLIFTDDEMVVNILIHATNDDLTDDTLQNFLENYKATLLGANIIKELITENGDKKIARLDYIIQNDTFEEVHHILFFAVDNKAVMIDFKYPKEESKTWDKICNYTLKSLEFVS